MKNIFLLLCLLLLTMGSYAQQTIQITRHPDQSPILEKYDVLKSDNNIKQGNYTRLYDKNKPFQIGYYKNNLKDSLWTSYTFNGKVRNKGMYKDGAKTGIWEYYINDTLENKYNFTNHELLYHRPQPADSAEYYVITDHDTTTTRLSRPPLFLGGQRDLSMQVNEQLVYYIGIIRSVRAIRIMLLYTVSENGEIINARVLRPGTALYDKESIRCFNSVDGEWIPGILDGKPVTVLQAIPFSLNGLGVINNVQ